MNQINVFVDTNILSLNNLSKLDKILGNGHFFYIKIDPTNLKDKKASELKKMSMNDSKSKYTYLITEAYLKNLEAISQNCLFENRYHEIQRIEDESFIFPLNYNNDKRLYKGWKFSDEITHNKETISNYENAINFLKEVNPNFNNHYPDMAIIATILSISDSYPFVRTLINKSMKWTCPNNVLPPFTNNNGLRYFVTSDKNGFFKKAKVEKIQTKYPHVRIINFEELINKGAQILI